jgi:hypothetical protein
MPSLSVAVLQGNHDGKQGWDRIHDGPVNGWQCLRSDGKQILRVDHTPFSSFAAALTDKARSGTGLALDAGVDRSALIALPDG